MLRCSICKTDYEHKFIDTLFLDFDTSNNDPKNMVKACYDCINAFKLKRAINAIMVLKTLGFKTDKAAMWKYNDKLVRDELTNTHELKAQIIQLKGQIKDLEGYIKMLEKHDFIKFDSTGGLWENIDK